MKIIPTPQLFEKSKELKKLNGFSAIELKIETNQMIENAINYLKEKFCLEQTCAEKLVLVYGDDKFFEQKNAKEQGYILTRKDGIVTITAQNSAGFFYGVMTLLQLYGNAPKEIVIKDRPNIRYRGNMNTLWAESAVWSYDFGDGLENALKRIYQAIDDMVKAKLNLMYYDAFGFACDRFPGYNKAMKSISEYAMARGMLTMVGGYGMGYGQSASYTFMGKVFKNKYPYPDGEEYECIGKCKQGLNKEIDDVFDISEVKGRTFGTCLTNTELTNDKIQEMLEYMRETGTRVLYLHNVDACEIHEALWLSRCARCKKLYPNDDLYAKDGAAGAFAAFFDQIVTALKQEFPEAIICPVSPGYADHYIVDSYFEKCRKFWAAVMKYAKRTDGVIPIFREAFVQHDDDRMRLNMIDESVQSYGCVYFINGDGYYGDKWFTPCGAYIKFMPNADLVICANGNAIQKTTQYADAEYLWNQNNSAFYNLGEISKDFKKMTRDYEDFSAGLVRDEGLYGEDGLLERSCELIFGEKYAKRIADLYRISGKENECPIFTFANVELWSGLLRKNLPMLWDTPVDRERQIEFRERFAESALATYTAKEILEEILENDDLPNKTREHLEFLHKASSITAKLCRLLKNYMDLYVEADKYFETGEKPQGDIVERAESVAKEADVYLAKIKNEAYKPFDKFGGIFVRREEMFDFVSYSARQIIKSIKTNKRVPDDRRPEKVLHWW